MNLVFLSVLGTWLLKTTTATVQGAEVADVKIQRQKRFLTNTCVFSTFKTHCNFNCETIGSYIVCFSATLNSVAIPEIADVEVKGNVNGLMVFWERIGRQSDPNPKPKCSVNICMVLYNVNPDKLSGCIQLKDEKTNATVAEVACFRTTLFGETTVHANAGETTPTVQPSSSDTSAGRASGTRSTAKSGTSCRLERSANGTMCTTEPAGQDVNGSSEIGTSLLILLQVFAILKMF